MALHFQLVQSYRVCESFFFFIFICLCSVLRVKRVTPSCGQAVPSAAHSFGPHFRFFFKFQKAKALDLKRQTVDQASCYLSEKFDQLDNPADLYCRSFLVFVCSRRRTPPPLGRWMAGGGACPDGRGLFLSLQRLVPT